MPKKPTVATALEALRAPDAKLVKLHTNDSAAGFYIWPHLGRIPEPVARALLERNDIQPYDDGLLPGHPQSWRLGDWRAWS